MKLYDQICDINKIEKIYYNIKLKTKHKKKNLNFEMYYMSNVMYLYHVLKERKYKHNYYHIFLVKEPKYRIIMSESIFDKIVNHLISEEILLPLIEPKLLDINVATRREKGTKLGLNYVKKYINAMRKQYENNFYILKCDISKYFYNIDHDILLSKLEKFITDKEIINIIKDILKTATDPATSQKIRKIINDELERLAKCTFDTTYKVNTLKNLPIYDKPKQGLPIGNMTSQIFAIFYLNDLDHYIKEQLHIKYYIRYMDDFILFHKSKKYLEYCYRKINEYVKKEKLSLNSKTKIFPMKEGLNFLGYRFIIKNDHLIILINPKTKKRIVRKINRIKNNKNYNQVLASYYGFFLGSNVKSLVNKYYKEHTF